MNQGPKILLRIKDFSVLRITRRFILSGWTIFSIYMFSINPLFFTSSSFVAILLIIVDYREYFILMENELRISKCYPISYFNKTKRIKLDAIDKVIYQKSEIDKVGILLTMLGLAFGIKTKSFLKIKLKNGNLDEYVTNGSSKQFELMIELIERELKLHTTAHKKEPRCQW